MRTLYLCGAGNPEGVRLALRINERTRRWNQIVLLDDDSGKHGGTIIGVPVAGGFELLESAGSDDEVHNLVTRTATGRMAARKRISQFRVPFTTLLSPDVDLMGIQIVGDTTVYQHATLGAGSTLETGTVVWMGAVVGHESRLGAYSIVASNAVLNARVTVGEGVYIGTNATVLPEIAIGAWATVGAGSVVMSDVPEGATAIGVPAEVVDFDRSQGSASTDQDQIEELILDALRRVLNDPSMRPDDNFFYCGGTSLGAMRLKVELEQLTGESIALVEIMRHPSARSLASFLCEPVAA